MARIRMTVVPRPDDVAEDGGPLLPADAEIPPLLTGTGIFDLVCGNCETVLLKNVEPLQVRGGTWRCSRCGSYNLNEGT